MLALKITTGIQFTMALLLLVQESPLNTTIGAITAFGTFANLVVLVGLIYKVGRYTGTTDTTIQAMEKSITSVTVAEEKIQATQQHHGESLVRLETESRNMMADLRTVRDRQHEFANILTQFTLNPVRLKSLERRDAEDKP